MRPAVIDLWRRLLAVFGEQDGRWAGPADRLEFTDPLTRLPNRAAFDAELRARVRAARPGQSFALAVIEIANIDSINQQYGGRAGDMVTRVVAGRLLSARKQGVFLGRTSSARFGGLGLVDNRAAAIARAQALHVALSQDALIESNIIPLDVRIGIAIFPTDTSDPGLLMQKGHAALTRAVADPLQPIAMHDEASDLGVRRRFILANDLRHALGRGEFELFYQPQVWIADGHVLGYEALLRWQHPTLGTISPAEFIPLAEKTGSIVPIGNWVLRAACLEAARWPKETHIAVNVSPLQLRRPDLPFTIQAALIEAGLAPDRLEIELTESLLIEDREQASRILGRIKALGVRLALDDFGTGFSSMEVLRWFRFDKVKLDKVFVDDVEANPQARAILHAMLTLGRALSVPILVEGVETRRQLEVLRNEGCNKVQGYLTGRPMPAASIRQTEPIPNSMSGEAAA